MKAKVDTEIFSGRQRVVDGLLARNRRIIRHFFLEKSPMFHCFVGIKCNFVGSKRNFEENKRNLVKSKRNFEENKRNLVGNKRNVEENKYILNIII